MVFVRDEGSHFDAPLDTVWRFLSEPSAHSEAHRHRATRRRSLAENSGEYSWVQDFDGAPTRFTMRWTAFPPVGVAYRVLEGPFTGSTFFLFYVPHGPRTEVVVAGEFVSPTLEERNVRSAVDRFFSVEFEQDGAAIAALGRASGEDRARPDRD